MFALHLQTGSAMAGTSRQESTNGWRLQHRQWAAEAVYAPPPQEWRRALLEMLALRQVGHGYRRPHALLRPARGARPHNLVNFCQPGLSFAMHLAA